MLLRIVPGAGERLEVWDDFVTGFGYRATRAKRGSFFLKYRFRGQRRRLTLGHYPAMSLGTARDKAKTALDLLAREIDPATHAEAEAAAENQRKARTVAAAITDFLRLHPYRPSTREVIRSVFARDVVPAIGAMPVSSVTRRHVAEVVNAVSDRGAGVSANRVLAYLSSFFGWLVARGELDASPVVALRKLAPERARDRVLSDAELLAVWRAAEALGAPARVRKKGRPLIGRELFAHFVQVLILTAQRRGEVASLRVRDVDLAARLWKLPREATKNDKAHDVPLSDPACAILRELIDAIPDNADKPDALLFLATKLRRRDDVAPRSFSGWSGLKRTLDSKVLALLREAAGDAADAKAPPGWTLHDLRRTAASGMAALGVAPHVVERLLNHSTGTIRGVAAIYNRHGYAPEMRVAVDAWGKHLEMLNAPAGSGAEARANQAPPA